MEHNAKPGISRGNKAVTITGISVQLQSAYYIYDVLKSHTIAYVQMYLECINDTFRKECSIQLEPSKLKQRIKNILSHLRCDPVLYIAMVAAIGSALFVPPSKDYVKYIDWRVIGLLLSLMLVVGGLQKVGAFGLIIKNLLKLVHNTRTLALVLVGVCFFSSMLITNDVALITFVPLGVMILTQTQKQKLLIPIIALQTVAANLGSMFTPLGNPQNLYLYALSNMTLFQFLRVMAVPTMVSFLLLFGMILLIKPEHITALESTTEIVGLKEIIPWMILFTLCLLAVLRILPIPIVLGVVVGATIIMDRRILFRPDYGLLLTFMFLFVLIGNIKSIPAVSTTLSAVISGREMLVGILLSQVISNVPAAMLLSNFTANYSALIVGVNLGGLGTLIASMASVISYKLYTATIGAQPGKYLILFTAINLVVLFALWGGLTLFTLVKAL